MNATTNYTGNITTSTSTSMSTDAGMLAAICGGFLVPLIMSVYISFVLCKRSRFSIFWGNTITLAGINLRVWNTVLRCVRCFPKTKQGSEGQGSSLCCCYDPKDFYKRHLCQRIWLYMATLLGMILPLLLLVLCGILTTQTIYPAQIGYGVLFLGLAILCACYAAASYAYNGWYVTTFATICITISGLLLCLYAVRIL
jgi:hypothetical protein